ncbi:MAG: Uma2 family endonuclease [Candidatus Poribacteria bacterium]|nr:Uma2 family endonuclease [Candidatus Poribacteria bacterium]
MSSAAARTYLTPEEYISFERKATIKHEYLKGQIIAMSGASFAHNFITLDTATQLNIQLMGGDCQVAASDMRVKVTKTNAYFYPDIVVFCGEPISEDNNFDTLLNPTVIIEVLSPSTETYDRGEKFEDYKQIESLKEYVLVSQDKVLVEHYIRQETEWLESKYRELDDVVQLRSIECELRMRDIYARTELVLNAS